MNEEKAVQWATVPEFLKLHHDIISKNTFYDWIREGRVPHLQIGRKILVPVDALDRMLVAIEESHD